MKIVISLLLAFAISEAFVFIPVNTLNKRPAETTVNMVKTKEKAYDSQAITVLKGLEPVRKRPGMYIGSTGQKGLHHLVFEVVDNSVDESLAGHCTDIQITLDSDGSVEVRDNGRGIPCSVHESTGKSSLETVLCVLHAGGKFGGDDSGYKVSGGLHGVGLSVVNALSERLEVQVVRDGKHHSMAFSKGIPVTEMVMRKSTKTETRGTTVRFFPDPEIFKTTLEFEFEKLADRMDELAYLNAGLTLTMVDKRKKREVPVLKDDIEEEEGVKPQKSGKKSKSVKNTGESDLPDNRRIDEFGVLTATFRHDGGIAELVNEQCLNKANLHPDVEVITVKQEKKGVLVEAALRWSKDQYTDVLSGFANGIRTGDGGTHLDGLKSAVAKTINSFAKKNGKVKDGNNIPGEFIREGLTAVVSVKVPEPEFEGQTKTRLGNPEVRTIVDQSVQEALTTLFEWNPSVCNQIVAKAQAAQTAASAAKAARDLVRRKSLLTSTVLPGKLADCSSRSPAESEIYIVEGDSAAGSAKLGRDRRTQAILPLKGKILNIEKASNEKIYQNTELQALISALGLGIRGVEFDTDTLRYHRIVIMTDADVDGAHIRLLLLTFFYRYQRALLANGHIFIACPPLYKVTSGAGRSKKETYLFDQKAMDEYMNTLTPTDKNALKPLVDEETIEKPKSSNISVQRFKGLGEMMPDQLWETTMDPAKRTLKLVSIEDAAAADRLFTVLMGDNVQPRKEFIINNADNLQLADLDY